MLSLSDTQKERVKEGGYFGETKLHTVTTNRATALSGLLKPNTRRVDCPRTSGDDKRKETEGNKRLWS